MILGRYVFHGDIASGGMATVCLGQMVGAAGFSRTVAIKRLHPHLVDDPEFSAMFLDEARLAARVRHPNVVSTLDVVSTEDELFLVMEYVPGESLAALGRRSAKGASDLDRRKTLGTMDAVPGPGAWGASGPAPRPVSGPESGVNDNVARRSTPLPPAVAAGIVAGALHGLHAAHEARGENGRPLEIVHRDVSPHNVLVGEDGVARLIDFGIARAAVRSQITRTGQLKGKLRYMAPEQLHGAAATRRVDVYATAVVLWEALTGNRLFDGETDAAIYGRILEGVVRPPGALVAVPPALDAVVLRGLARDPEARWATALEMATALDAAITPAPPAEVAGWLQRTAGPILAERARRVQAIEGGGVDPVQAHQALAAPRSARVGESTRRSRAVSSRRPGLVASSANAAEAGEAPSTATPPVQLDAQPKRSGARRSAVAAGAGLVIALALAVGTRARPGSALEARRGVAAAALLASLRASTSTGPDGAALPPASATAAGPDPAAPPAGQRAPNPGVRWGYARQDTGAGSARGRAPDSVSRRTACDPPYYLDGTGIRRVKRECL